MCWIEFWTWINHCIHVGGLFSGTPYWREEIDKTIDYLTCPQLFRPDHNCNNQRIANKSEDEDQRIKNKAKHMRHFSFSGIKWLWSLRGWHNFTPISITSAVYSSISIGWKNVHLFSSFYCSCFVQENLLKFCFQNFFPVRCWFTNWPSDKAYINYIMPVAQTTEQHVDARLKGRANRAHKKSYSPFRKAKPLCSLIFSLDNQWLIWHGKHTFKIIFWKNEYLKRILRQNEDCR